MPRYTNRPGSQFYGEEYDIGPVYRPPGTGGFDIGEPPVTPPGPPGLLDQDYLIPPFDSRGPSTGEGSTGIGGDIGAPSPGGPGPVGLGGNQVDPNDIGGMLAGIESNNQDLTALNILGALFGAVPTPAPFSNPFSFATLAGRTGAQAGSQNLRSQINEAMGRQIGDLDNPDVEDPMGLIDEGIGMTSGQPAVDDPTGLGIGIGLSGLGLSGAPSEGVTGPQSDVDMGMVDMGIGMTSEGGGGGGGSSGGGDASSGGESGPGGAPGDPGGAWHRGGIVRMGGGMPMMGMRPGGDEDRDGRRNVMAMLEEGERVIPAKKRAGGMGIRPGGKVRGRK